MGEVSECAHVFARVPESVCMCVRERRARMYSVCCTTAEG